MAQQTAVEWLINQVEDNMGDIPPEIKEQVKQMEKEQMENAKPKITPNCVTKEKSDKEIDKASLKVGYVHRDNAMAFQTVAKWYREELKKA